MAHRPSRRSAHLEQPPQIKRQDARELHEAIAKACGCWPLQEPRHPGSWNAELQVREELLDVEVLDDDGLPFRPWATFVTSASGDVLAVRLAKDTASFGDIAEIIARLRKHYGAERPSLHLERGHRRAAERLATTGEH